ncbi:MAG: glycosyltransferase family 39 protein [Acutalibacteraceae bacterium]|nr:glycosyltransferase family 39 protein [Acutalibacteraceae bacterium]
MKKLKEQSNVVFNYVFAVLFSIITIGASTVLFNNIFVVITTALFMLTLIFLGGRLYKSDKEITEKQVNVFFMIMIAVMFIVQLIFGYFLKSTPVTDWGTIDTIAKNFAENGNFENMYEGLPKGRHQYMARYPNNNGILILLSLYYRVIYLILGWVPIYAAIVLNTIFITTSVVFTFLIAKKIFKPKGALITAIACFIFLPYYTYTAYYYSDSLSIPFTTISVYLVILGAKSEKEKWGKKILYLLLAGLSTAIGYTLKGSLLVILVGAVVYFVLCNKPKKALISCVGIIVATAVFISGINSFVNSFNFTNEEELYEQQYPINHWIMMGLKDEGDFNQDDATFTRNAGNYNQKKAAANKQIDKRLEEMGLIGLAEHLYEKIIFTWDDGTYWISNHINSKDEKGNEIENRNILFEFVLKDGKYHNVFYLYSNSLHMCILMLIVVSGFLSAKKKKITKMTLIHGIIFGVTLFFMMWETRSRYLFNFTPLFILTAVNGFIFLCDTLKLPELKHTFQKNPLKILFNKN